MPRTNRMFELLSILRDGQLHTAQDMARKLSVSERTIYRDMDALQSAGVPVQGERGVGYRATGVTTLPPLSLSPAELDALNLGIAIVAQAGDETLATAAQSLADKVDAGLPEQVISDADTWKFATSPLADAARGLQHLTTLRSAIKARQKIELGHVSLDGHRQDEVVRPLKLDNWGRVWTLLSWSETRTRFVELRVDLIDVATPMQELFEDETGKSPEDFRPGQGA